MPLPRWRSALMAATALHAAAVAGTPAAAQSQPAASFPSRNILLVVPFAPGGPPDVIARVLAPALGEALGKAIIVENRAGASTSIGTASVARAAPDGYTLLASSLAMVVVPYILSRPGFDPINDLKPVSLTGTSVQTLVISSALPINNIADLISYARRLPGGLRAAHTGIGTSPHLGLVALMHVADIELLLVPYRGAAQAISDIVAGHISMLMTAPSTSVNLALEGKVRILGVTGDKRLTAMPDIPTLRESGLHLASFDQGVWFGISAPAGTPDDIVARLNEAVVKAVHDKSATETLAKSDIVANSSSPEQYGTLIHSQIGVWRDLLKNAGIKPE